MTVSGTLLSRFSRETTNFNWPVGQFYAYSVFTLISAVVVTGCCANALEIQNQLTLPGLWLFPFGIAAGVIGIVLTTTSILLLSCYYLTPGFTLIFSAINFTLFLTGLVGTAIQMFGAGKVSSDCQAFILSKPVSGPTLATLAWLHQRGLCNSWYTAFAFWIIGTILQPWMMYMSAQVSKNRVANEDAYSEALERDSYTGRSHSRYSHPQSRASYHPPRPPVSGSGFTSTSMATTSYMTNSQPPHRHSYRD